MVPRAMASAVSDWRPSTGGSILRASWGMSLHNRV
jgi:hypothetical protein